MRPPARHALTGLLVLTLLLGSCASAPEPATVIRTLYNPGIPGYNNILVISVAGDYASREAFERDLVASLTRAGGSASPWYSVVGRRSGLSRSLMLDSIRSRGFDAVLFTRRKGQEQRELAPTRPVGPAFDLFGYDYDELNRDVQIEQSRAITFISELYDAAEQRKVWSIETLSVRKNTLQALLDEQVVTVATQLREDGLLGR